QDRFDHFRQREPRHAVALREQRARHRGERRAGIGAVQQVHVLLLQGGVGLSRKKATRVRIPAVNPEPAAVARTPVLRHAFLLSAILAIAWLVYSNSFRAPFLLDNEGIVLQDSRVQAVTPVALRRIWTEQYWPTANTGLYRPLDTMSFLFDYAVLGQGADPYGYHWLNFVLHALNIVLVYLLGL